MVTSMFADDLIEDIYASEAEPEETEETEEDAESEGGEFHPEDMPHG